jgi:RHS repeat-associated protein
MGRRRGVEQTSPGDDFATYWKDASTGFEYAMNRYYSTGYGRFLTVDPFGGSARVGSPAAGTGTRTRAGIPSMPTTPAVSSTARRSALCVRCPLAFSMAETEESIPAPTVAAVFAPGATVAGPWMHISGAFRAWRRVASLSSRLLRAAAQGPVLTGA